MNGIEKEIRNLGVVPVAVLEDIAGAVPLAEALAKGGLPCVEVTFRTDAAEESIRRISLADPDMLVGAGTVLSIGQAECACAAGAKFIVAPGFDSELVEWCVANEVPVFPGCATPSDVTQAVKHGLSTVKLFPAGQLGGVAAVKALGGPFPGMSFIPTGGVNAGNLAEYLANPKVAAVGGTWIAKAMLINSGDFDKIEELSREAVGIVKEVRE